MAATTTAELNLRAACVAEWMIQSLSFSEIVARAKEDWGVCRRTVSNYVSQANELIAQEASKNVSAEIAKAKGRLERIMRLAEEEGDLQAAIAAQREIIKLLGLSAPQKQEVAHQCDDPVARLLAQIVNSPDCPTPLER